MLAMSTPDRMALEMMDRADIHYFVAEAERMAGNHATALEAYAGALKIDPLMAAAYYGRAQSLIQTGQLLLAAEAFQRAVALYPPGIRPCAAAPSSPFLLDALRPRPTAVLTRLYFRRPCTFSVLHVNSYLKIATALAIEFPVNQRLKITTLSDIMQNLHDIKSLRVSYYANWQISVKARTILKVQYQELHTSTCTTHDRQLCECSILRYDSAGPADTLGADYLLQADAVRRVSRSARAGSRGGRGAGHSGAATGARRISDR